MNKGTNDSEKWTKLALKTIQLFAGLADYFTVWTRVVTGSPGSGWILLFPSQGKATEQLQIREHIDYG